MVKAFVPHRYTVLLCAAVLSLTLFPALPQPSFAAAVGRYHGNVKTHEFHNRACPQYDCKDCYAYFNSIKEARAAGFKACKKCKKYNRLPYRQQKNIFLW